MKNIPTTALVLAAVLMLASTATAAIIPYYGRLLTASYTTTAAIDSDDLDCPPSSTGIGLDVKATTDGTLQAYYLPLGGEAATAMDSAVSITANTLQTIHFARPGGKRTRYRFTPSSSTGSVWVDGFCGGGTR